jgi:hypothetical protein
MSVPHQVLISTSGIRQCEDEGGGTTYVKIINLLSRRLPISTLGELFFAALKRHRPMYEEEIHIVKTEVI